MSKKLRKYEKDLLIGTIFTLVGVIFLTWRFHLWFSWFVIVVGKIIIIFSVMEYVDYRRRWRGEDLSKDNSLRKTIRKVRKKYRY